jgi:hypothetical protein
VKRTPLKRKTPLRAKTRLKSNGFHLKQTPLKKVSTKQKTKNKVWSEIKEQRISMLKEKFGYLCDEFTGENIIYGHTIDAHHNDRHHNHNTLDNCRILTRQNHIFITDNNIKDVPDRLKIAEILSNSDIIGGRQ